MLSTGLGGQGALRPQWRRLTPPRNLASPSFPDRLCAVPERSSPVPIAGLGLHILIALCFAVHALRTGQDKYWLFILFMFPGLGSLVYAVAIWLPEVRNSRAGHRLVATVQRAVDPGRELREAQAAFDLSPSADHRLRLADALLEAGHADEAVEQYRAAMRNVHRDDPVIHVRLAHALLEAGKAGTARDELDALRRAHPAFRSPEGHLVYARALGALDDRIRAREEFESLIGYYAGYEPRARYAELLHRWNEVEAARALAESALKHAARLPGYSRRMNSEWLKRLERIARGEAPASV
jgi:hypothetical protein